MKSIVDNYVSLKNRAALEELREHRRRLRDQLQRKAGQWFDVSYTLQLVDDDLLVIDEGFTRLQS